MYVCNTLPLDNLKIYSHLALPYITVMDKATSVAKLAKIDVSEKENLVPAKNVDIGFATRKVVNNLQAKKEASGRKNLEFQSQCLTFLQTLSTKLLERCPLQYPVVRYLTCLDPRYMAARPEQATNKMTQLLKKLLHLRQRRAEDCDAIIRQYKTFLGEIKKHSLQSFAEFKHTEEGVDTFLFSYLGNIPRYQEMWELLKLLVILSHGQAQVERGFSTKTYCQPTWQKNQWLLTGKFMMASKV